MAKRKLQKPKPTGESATADKKTQTTATVTSVLHETHVAAAVKASTSNMDDLDARIAKKLKSLAAEEPPIEPIDEDIQRWADIIDLLRDKEMEFTWSEETHCVVATNPIYWDRLKTIPHRRHLCAYRTLPFPAFKRRHHRATVPLVPKADNPTLLYMTYKIKTRLAMQEKGVRILSLEEWDGQDDPWARRHFFDVRSPAMVMQMMSNNTLKIVERASRIYLMMKNTIEMGWLTWDKKKNMLSGPPSMWNMHQCKEIKIWKGTPFPDFYSWQFILDQPVDVSKLIPQDTFAPNAYRNFYHEVNGSDEERRDIKCFPAPLVFGLGTNNKIAKQMWEAIKQYRWETYQIYTNLTHPGMEFDEIEMSLIGTDDAWDAISCPMTIGDLGFDGSIWWGKHAPLFFKGLFYFENIVSRQWEQVREKAVSAQAKRLLTDPPTGASKAMIKELQQLKKDADFHDRKLTYQEKKLADYQKSRKANPGAEASGQQLNGCPACHSQPCQKDSCHSESCVTCSVGCKIYNHGFIRMREIFDRESVSYACFPTRRLEIDLIFEPTEPRTLQTILEEFRLLQTFDNPFFNDLAKYDFAKGAAWHEALLGPKVRRPSRYGKGLIDRESPFRLRSERWGGDDDIGGDIYIDGPDADELFEKGHIPNLRKMVCFAGEKGRQEMKEYLFNLKIGYTTEEKAPRYIEFINSLGQKMDRWQDSEHEMYRVKGNEFGFRKEEDLGFGIMLLENMFSDECIPLLRKFVMDAGIAWRGVTERRLRKEGIEVLDKLTLGDNDRTTLLDILKKPQLTVEHTCVKQMKACGVFDNNAATLETVIEADPRVQEQLYRGAIGRFHLGLKKPLDIGHGLRLADRYCVRDLNNKVDLVLRGECRELVLRHGKENRLTAMRILEGRGIKVEDMLEPRRAAAEAKGSKVWVREPKKRSRMDLIDRIMRKKVEKEMKDESVMKNEEESGPEGMRRRVKGVPDRMLWKKGARVVHESSEREEGKWEKEKGEKDKENMEPEGPLADEGYDGENPY